MKPLAILSAFLLSSCYTSRVVRYPDGRWERTVAVGLKSEINANWLTGTTVKADSSPGSIVGMIGAFAGKVVGL